MVKKELIVIESQCCTMTDKFIRQEIAAEEFCSDLVRLWIHFRDEQEKIKESWEEPYDQRLVSDRLSGLITAEEFSKRYRELWKLDEIANFSRLIDGVHSACNIFNRSPENEWEIDEQQFRLEVYSLFKNYRHSDLST